MHTFDKKPRTDYISGATEGQAKANQDVNTIKSLLAQTAKQRSPQGGVAKAFKEYKDSQAKKVKQ